MWLKCHVSTLFSLLELETDYIKLYLSMANKFNCQHVVVFQ